MNKITAQTISGDMITVDISDDACAKFGYKHGDRIIYKSASNYPGKVIGVAPISNGEQKALWFAFDEDHGRISFMEPETFKLIYPEKSN